MPPWPSSVAYTTGPLSLKFGGCGFESQGGERLSADRACKNLVPAT